MKKFYGVIKRAELYEEKNGITYAKPDKRLYKGLRIFNTVALVYTFCINLLYVTGVLLVNAGTKDFGAYLPSVIIVSACTLVLIVANILDYKGFNISVSITELVPPVILAVLFGIMLRPDADPNTVWGFTKSYFWRHLIPLTLIFIIAVSKFVIALSARFKFNKSYKRTLNTLYILYHEANADCGEQDWLEFIQNYNGESPNDIFPEIYNENSITE